MKMSSDFNFTDTSWFLGNVGVKPHWTHSAPLLKMVDVIYGRPLCDIWGVNVNQIQNIPLDSMRYNFENLSIKGVTFFSNPTSILIFYFITKNFHQSY